MKRRIKTGCLLVWMVAVVSTGLHAQTPYQGGEGDGYAMTEWTNGTISGQHTGETGRIDVYPSVARSGDVVRWESAQAVAEVRLFRSDGVCVQREVDVRPQRFQLEAHAPGSYWIQLGTPENRYYYARLIILGD